MVEGLNFAEFVRAAARLGKLAMTAILDLTGIGQVEAGLKSNGTGRAAVRLPVRPDSYEQVMTGLRRDFGHVTEGLHSNGRAQGRLMQETWWS